MAGRIFCFTEDKLCEHLEAWLKQQREKNPALLDHHAEYLKASVLAFMFSDEAQKLRMTNIENTVTKIEERLHENK